MIDPSMFLTLAPQARISMTLSALAVCFDALVCGNMRGVLDQHGMSKKIIQGSTSIAQGLRLGNPLDLAQGSIAAGELLGLCQAPPIQVRITHWLLVLSSFVGSHSSDNV